MSRGGMNRPLIYVVDDDPLTAAMVAMTFEDAGFEVQTAADAAEALPQITELDAQVSALVTDIQLGDGPNGWAIATLARTRLPHLPVVYMTGDSASDWSAFGVPRSVLIQKPFAGAQVLAAVTTLMNAASGDDHPSS